MDKTDGPRDIDGIRAAMADAPEFDGLQDTATRRHQLYQLIAEHPDPLWREIGQQLRDGQLRPTEVLSIPEYRDQLRTGMADGLERLTQMVDALEDHLRTDAVDQPSDGRTAGDGADQYSDDDLSETLGPILRRR